MKKILKSNVFIVIVTILCAGLILAQTISYPEFEKINSFEIDSYDNSVFSASMNVGIQNSNWFSIKGEEIEFRLNYKNHLIATGSSREAVQFKRKSLSNLAVQLEFYPDSLRNELKEILLSDSLRIDMEITGKFTILGIRSQRVVSTWIKTDELINTLIAHTFGGDGLRLKSVQFVNGGIQKSSYKVVFDLKNTLRSPVVLNKMNYSIYADKSKENRLAISDFKLNKNINPNASETIEGNIEIANLTSALTGFSKVLNGKLDYYLDGYALITLKGRSINIPIKEHFSIEPFTQENIIFN
jgi:LEA14-like dessication related protein